MKKSNYPANECMKDVFGLLSFVTEAVFGKGCAFCGKETHTIGGMESENGLHCVCKVCSDCATTRHATTPAKVLLIPDNEDERLELFGATLATLGREAKKQKALPIIVRGPGLAGSQPNEAIVVFLEKGKLSKAVVPFPWFPDDPQAAGGKIARDALALYRSIKSGDTEAYSIGGGMVLMPGPELSREWLK